eukprot:CAMPEP_0194275536 /NCGR_PEP_ID=MMETSP0169-20130528/8347_1 /TAXON_ID=218684 /ORGANISM="Corethron pennatum, Strain L29A3" /LENGTH=1126 /DNA_ID=CAMNT_0039019019 /DNA_START=115 /DNA_END=3495 /DNA_ORIENTATION=-
MLASRTSHDLTSRDPTPSSRRLILLLLLHYFAHCDASAYPYVRWKLQLGPGSLSAPLFRRRNAPLRILSYVYQTSDNGTLYRIYAGDTDGESIKYVPEKLAKDRPVDCRSGAVRLQGDDNKDGAALVYSVVDLPPRGCVGAYSTDQTGDADKDGDGEECTATSRIIALSSDLKELWTTEISGAASQPVSSAYGSVAVSTSEIADQLVPNILRYKQTATKSGGAVFVLDGDKGKIKFEWEHPHNLPLAPLGLDGAGRWAYVCAATDGGRGNIGGTYGVDLLEYKMVYVHQGDWSASETAPVVQETRAGEAVYVAASGAGVQAFKGSGSGAFEGDWSAARPVWRAQLESWEADAREPVPYTPSLNPIRPILYAISPSSSISAVDTSTGALLWNYYSSSSSFVGSALPSPGGIYVYSVEHDTGTVRRHDAVTGEVDWEHSIASPVSAPPSLSDDGSHIFFVDLLGLAVNLAVADPYLPPPTEVPTESLIPSRAISWAPTVRPSTAGPTRTASPSGVDRTAAYPFVLNVRFIYGGTWGIPGENNPPPDLSALAGAAEAHLSFYARMETNVLRVVLEQTSIHMGLRTAARVGSTDDFDAESNLEAKLGFNVWAVNGRAFVSPSAAELGLVTAEAFTGDGEREFLLMLRDSSEILLTAVHAHAVVFGPERTIDLGFFVMELVTASGDGVFEKDRFVGIINEFLAEQFRGGMVGAGEDYMFGFVSVNLREKETQQQWVASLELGIEVMIKGDNGPGPRELLAFLMDLFGSNVSSGVTLAEVDLLAVLQSSSDPFLQRVYQVTLTVKKEQGFGTKFVPELASDESGKEQYNPELAPLHYVIFAVAVSFTAAVLIILLILARRQHHEHDSSSFDGEGSPGNETKHKMNVTEDNSFASYTPSLPSVIEMNGRTHSMDDDCSTLFDSIASVSNTEIASQVDDGVTWQPGNGVLKSISKGAQARDRLRLDIIRRSNINKFWSKKRCTSPARQEVPIAEISGERIGETYDACDIRIMGMTERKSSMTDACFSVVDSIAPPACQLDDDVTRQPARQEVIILDIPEERIKEACDSSVGKDEENIRGACDSSFVKNEKNIRDSVNKDQETKIVDISQDKGFELIMENLGNTLCFGITGDTQL